MKSLVALAWPRSGRYSLSLLLSVLQGLSAVALLATSAWLISRAAQQPPIMYLSIAVVGVRTFALARASLRYAERWLSHDAVMSSTAALRVKLFKKLIDFAPAGLGETSASDLSTKIIADVDETQNLGLRIFGPLVQSIAVSVVSVTFFWFLLPEAAVVLTLALGVAFVLALPVTALIAKSADRSSASDRAKMNLHTSELLEHYELLGAYSWLGDAKTRIEQVQKRLARNAAKQSIASGVAQAVFSFGAGVTAVLAAVLGAQYVAAANAPAEMLAVYALLPLAVFDVASGSQSIVGFWRRFSASGKRLTQLLERDLPLELQDYSGSKHLDDVGEIALTNVSLGYPGSQTVVHNFSIHVRAGESLAISGASGVGKSTVALALAGLLRPRAGDLMVNAEPAVNFDSAELRRHIGYLEQTPALFPSSVSVNLKLAKPNATDAELAEVLSQVGLLDMLNEREGLETQVGEMAALLSGGEAQRLAFARAILADFDCIILDEPTANVDKANAQRLVADFLKIAAQRNKMVILITHDQDLAALTQRQLRL